MMLSYDKTRGTCTITGRTMADKGSCSGSANNGGLMLRYPCKPFNGTTPKIQGPAMNLWVSPAAAASTGSRALMLPNGQSATCNMTMLAPALYYHMRTPPVYTYGYQLRGLPCGTMKSADAVGALRKPGTMLKSGERFAMTYGLWVMPTLPGPQDKQFSTASQKCTLIATAVGKTFHSTSSFPCNFRPMPASALGKGCCYDPLGLRHRRLMSADILQAYTQAALRRMM